MKLKDKLAFALDISSSKEAIDMVNLLKGHVGYFKIGPQLFIRCGPDIVKRVQDRGAKVFLDLKLYDIPNTVSKSVESAISLGVDFLPPCPGSSLPIGPSAILKLYANTLKTFSTRTVKNQFMVSLIKWNCT